MAKTQQLVLPKTHPNEIIAIQNQIMAKIAQIHSENPAVYGQTAYHLLGEILGLKDPYRNLKDQFNSLALSLIPRLQEIINTAPDPVLMAITIAILGNTLDFGTFHAIDIEKDIQSLIQNPQMLAVNHYQELARDLEKANTILIIGDNAGEIVLDRIMVETLKKVYPLKTLVYAVRGGPIINDATKEDAIQVDFPRICLVVEGSASPGVILEECSSEFRQIFNKEANLILSKGQGNFESLDEILPPQVSVYFMLKTKCQLVSDLFQVPMGSLVLTQRDMQRKFQKKLSSFIQG
jgi:uncharacterized protein with ATP-grasp and redox domains